MPVEFYRQQAAQQQDQDKQNAIEKGDYNPTIKLCISICKALDRTLDELFWEDDNETSGE